MAVGAFTPTGGDAIPFRTYFEIEIEVELELTTPLAVTEEMSECLVTASLGQSRLASAGRCESTN